jgi:hypothetical protein
VYFILQILHHIDWEKKNLILQLLSGLRNPVENTVNEHSKDGQPSGHAQNAKEAHFVHKNFICLKTIKLSAKNRLFVTW